MVSINVVKRNSVVQTFLSLDKGLLKYNSKLSRSPSFKWSLYTINFFVCWHEVNSSPQKVKGSIVPKGYPCEHDYIRAHVGNGRIPYKIKIRVDVLKRLLYWSQYNLITLDSCRWFEALILFWRAPFFFLFKQDFFFRSLF